MTKQKKITNIEREIDLLHKQIDKKLQEIETLKSKEEVTLSFMFQEYENENSTIVKKQIRDGSYTYVLGGDGRSCPWDEVRHGKILHVDFKGIYLTGEDLSKFKAYIETTKDKNINCIKINGSQI